MQIGTFSKTFLPGARLGWAAGPARVVAQLVVAKQNSDQCAGALGRWMLEEFLRGGHLDGMATWTEPSGGFITWPRLPGVDTTALATRAREVSVAFVPGAGFFADRVDNEHLRLSYSRVAEADVEPAMARPAATVRLDQRTSRLP